MKVFVIGGLPSDQIEPSSEDQKALARACYALGKNLVRAGHEILLCSPFENSADIHVLRGAAELGCDLKNRVRFFYMDSPFVKERLNAELSSLGLQRVTRVPSPPPQTVDQKAERYAWLLCQLNAMESCQVVVALGGKSNGAANMLLLLAESKKKAVLPLAFLGGAARIAFDRRRYELTDRLGEAIEELHDEACVANVSDLVEAIAMRGVAGGASETESPLFFISYARDRQGEADFVETLLRRRNLRVFRDESDFGAGHSIPTRIREAIFEANIFVALWSSAYACSPWCFDEMELALDRHEEGKLELWILRVDDTRIVPKRARELLFYDASSRVDVEGRMLQLLARYVSGGGLLK